MLTAPGESNDLSPRSCHLPVLLSLIAIAMGLGGCRHPLLRLSPSPAVVTFAPTTVPPAMPTTLPVATPSMPSATTTPAGVPRTTDDDAPALPPAELTLITHGDRSLPYVALTFDACQTAGHPAGYDEAVIRILNDGGTPATLFLGGLWIQRHPSPTRALATNPLFELGNHSWSHPDFAHLSPKDMSAEILRTQEIMENLTGRQATIFRFPYGTHTDEALEVVARHGLLAVGWDVESGDPGPNASPDSIVEAISAQVQNGSIVILHMNRPGGPTAEAVSDVIEQLRARGYQFVTVSQLLGLEPDALGATGRVRSD